MKDQIVKPIRAVEYIRMSTDLQRYSVLNQQQRIAEYALLHGITVIRTYKDEGKSGLKINRREALQSLLDVVSTGRADFELILVFDISRWGRFQDSDESAYYEFICRAAGVKVIYCAERFENDGTPISNIMKGLKRVMAAEYSRELSEKVFRGKHTLAKLGFHVGSPSAYGLRRVMVDAHGKVRAEMQYGERKAFQSDKVILMPGSKEEIEIVRLVFKWFVEEKLFYKHIADRLTAMGVPAPAPNFQWTKIIIKTMVSNLNYRGTVFFNKTSARLSTPKVNNPKNEWVIKENALPAIIDKKLFSAAQLRIKNNPKLNEKAEMIKTLADIYAIHGRISATLLKTIPNAPSHETLRKYFGTVNNAYYEAGFNPFLEKNLRERKKRITAKIMNDYITRLVRDLRDFGLSVRRYYKLSIFVGRHLQIAVIPTLATRLHPKERVHIHHQVQACLVINIYSRDPEGEFYFVHKENMVPHSFYLNDNKGVFDADRWRCSWEELPELISSTSAKWWKTLSNNEYQFAFEAIQEIVRQNN